MTDAIEPQDEAAAAPSAATDWETVLGRLSTAYQVSTSSKGKMSARERTRILHDRAEILARPLVGGDVADDDLQVLEFSLGDERYGIESSAVREIYPIKEITPLPGMPTFVLGIVAVRGRICSVFDIGRLFDRAAREAKSFKMAVVLASADMEFALLVDEIVGTRIVRSSELQTDIPSLTGARREYLKGVTTDRMVVLDAARLLGDEKLLVRKES